MRSIERIYELKLVFEIRGTGGADPLVRAGRPVPLKYARLLVGSAKDALRNQAPDEELRPSEWSVRHVPWGVCRRATERQYRD
jgi:hypothetical protein